MERRVFVTVLAGALMAGASGVAAQGGPPPAPAQKPRPRWGSQAEKEFRIGRGLAPRLMTEEEWKEHQAKMRAMSAEERERYRREVHQTMVERAREKGIDLAPRPPAGGGPPRRPPG